MADYRLLVALFLAKEGGMSNDQDDTASRSPCPCRMTYRGRTASNWHTNKGVTWATFTGLSAQIGYSASCDNFAKMPPSIWGPIFKRGYWDQWSLDRMKSEPIAAVLVWWSWGSGPAGALRLVQKYLRTKGLDANSRSQAASVLDTLVERHGPERIFEEMKAVRLEFYRTRSNAWKYYKGWSSAYEKFHNWASSQGWLVDGGGTGIPLLLLAVLGLGASGAWAYHHHQKRKS